MPNGNVPHKDAPIEGVPNNVTTDKDAPNESPGNQIPAVGVVPYKVSTFHTNKYQCKNPCNLLYQNPAGVWYYKILDLNLHESPNPTPAEPNPATPNPPNEDPENANPVNKDPASQAKPTP
ncbi:hypothetical protein BS47DRAFT_1361826 [Hydnum rufescens UP504]|uniref:Uncharacterized protein n=1 Tax=Hydnum rufescens UP504 TaxID=1448309 RepID=A0A9P6AYQ1_9AGAM|nr:hypothetical protein BS47DRAFT_1361826 [Hydnum rufescens UP504]